MRIQIDELPEDSCVLTPIRTAFGREQRKLGNDRFCNRNYVPRKDGISNTLTTVQKDNMLLEVICVKDE